MSAGFLQEQDGSKSSRRLFALYFALLSGELFNVGAWTGNMAGVYGGVFCGFAVLILSGYTTVSEIKGLVTSIKSNYPEKQDSSEIAHRVDTISTYEPKN